MRDPTEEETKSAQDFIAPYRKQVTDTPALLSILYDLYLLPEQIRMPINAARMVVICGLFKVLPQEEIDKLRFEA